MVSAGAELRLCVGSCYANAYGNTGMRITVHMGTATVYRRITFVRDGVCDLRNKLLKCSYARMFASTHVTGANLCFEVYCPNPCENCKQCPPFPLGRLTSGPDSIQTLCRRCKHSTCAVEAT